MAGDLQKLETAEIKRLHRKKRKFIGWMLDSKHTGVEVAKRVAVAFERRANDAQLALALEDACELHGNIGKVETTEKGNLKKSVSIKMVWTVVLKVKAASPEFNEAHKEELEKLRVLLRDAEDALITFTLSQLGQIVSEFILDQFCLQPGDGGSAEVC